MSYCKGFFYPNKKKIFLNKGGIALDWTQIILSKLENGKNEHKNFP
jgi:hypothetical protein